jgi:hypothetical protein
MSQYQFFSSVGTPGVPNIEFVEGNDSVVVGPNSTTHIINIVGNANQGVSVTGNALTNTETINVQTNYTNVTTAMSPYTAISSDHFISCDATAGPITILLPNSPSVPREFIIKDRLGVAATNNITITTVGGIDTIDGMTTYIFTDDYESLEMLFNGTSYETF